MFYRAMFHTNVARTRLLLLDENEGRPYLVTPAERSPICRNRVLDCEDICGIP